MAELSEDRLSRMQRNTDHGMRLMLVRPGERVPYGSVKHIFDFTATWNRTDPSRLRFKAYKDSPGVADLQNDVELIVELWEPWRRKWIQPVNSRFVIDNWKEDLADETNLIEYSAIQAVAMLDKSLVYRRPVDGGLNHALDKAEEAFRDAESNFKNAWRTFNRSCGVIRQRHGMWGGHQFAQVGFPASTASRRIPNGSMGVLGRRTNGRWTGDLYYFSGGKWKKLSRAKWADDKRDLVVDGLDVLRKRRVMNIRRDQLRKATIAARETSRGGRRYFYNRSAGHIIQVLFNEGRRRDASRGFNHNQGNTRLKGVARSFSNIRDSQGNIWGSRTKASIETRVGQGIFSVLLDLQERGLCDWQTRNGTLDLVPAGKLRVNQSSRVVIRLGQDVQEGVTNGSRMEHASASIIIGQDGQTWEYRSGGSGAETPWGYWEGSISESAADGGTLAARLTAAQRAEMVKRFKVEPSRKVVVGQNSALPMVDYQPHHWISVYDYSGGRASRMVEQIILTQGDATQPLEAVISFETRFQSTPVRFNKSLAKTMGGIDHMQGRIPIDQDPAVPPEIEAELRMSNIAPPIEDIAGAVKFNEEGQPRVSLKITWAANYEAEAPPIPEEQYNDLIEETESSPSDDGFEEEEE